MNEVLEIESIPTKIKYKDIVWIPEGTSNKEPDSMSAEKMKVWLRLKDIKDFDLDDVREAFPEWSKYAKSQLLFKVNHLIKNNNVQQLHTGEFKVLKS